MIRHLSAVHFDRRGKDSDGCTVIRWRQWKRSSDDAPGQITHKDSMFGDEQSPKMKYNKEGKRVRVVEKVPRYPVAKRRALARKAEALRKKLAKVAGRDIDRFGYAPGSASVDVWFTKGDVEQHIALTDQASHKAVHAFVKLLATEIADPEQPLQIWDRVTE